MDFTFDPRSQRFRYTSGIYAGQFVSRKDVAEVIENNITRIKGDLGTITNLLLENKITVATWEDTVSSTIKKGVVQSYLAGKGGTYQLKPQDKGILGQALGNEYGYLRQFSQAILDGELSAAQIADRANKYADSFHKYYERGRSEGHKNNGYKWELWVTSGSGMVCPDCVGYAMQRWQRIGSLPGIGTASSCRMRCRCHKEYSTELNQPQDSLLLNKYGWLNMKTTEQRLDEISQRLEQISSTFIDNIPLDDDGWEGSNSISIGDKLSTADLIASSGKRTLYMGEPTPEDLAKIKTLTGDDRWEGSEWFVVPLRASDNLLSRSQRVWHENILNQMPKQLIGRSLLEDHSWNEVDDSIGVIFDSFVTADIVSDDVIYSGNRGEFNQQIVNQKGCKAVYCLAAIHASKPEEIMGVKTMRFDKCSTGGMLSDIDVICPNCSAEYGREVSFFETDDRGNYICPHEMPGGGYYEEDSLVADYAIWDGIFDGVELSLCVVGNLPGAGVVR